LNRMPLLGRHVHPIHSWDPLFVPGGRSERCYSNRNSQGGAGRETGRVAGEGGREGWMEGGREELG
jgi:hypothetical protein